MTTITLRLHDDIPLCALTNFAESFNCTLHHTIGHGFEMRRRCPYRETGLLANIASDLCAAWAAGGIRAVSYLEQARRVAVLTTDYEAAEELHLLRLMLKKKFPALSEAA